jgi:broad specificity phosphatase PhoE
MPETIMLIRHAEKPSEDGRVGGVDPSGKADGHSLSALGWQRAGALVRFFASPAGGSPVLRPDALFATAVRPGSPSRRPLQTLEPLAAMLGAKVNAEHGRHEVDALLDAVAAVPGTVLISWTHRTINEIAAHLLGDADVPAQWPDERFDMVWVFHRQDPNWSLLQVPQMLLAGDSGDPI